MIRLILSIADPAGELLQTSRVYDEVLVGAVKPVRTWSIARTIRIRTRSTNLDGSPPDDALKIEKGDADHFDVTQRKIGVFVR
jgi:hypothetical protein